MDGVNDNDDGCHDDGDDECHDDDGDDNKNVFDNKCYPIPPLWWAELVVHLCIPLHCPGGFYNNVYFLFCDNYLILL